MNFTLIQCSSVYRDVASPADILRRPSRFPSWGTAETKNAKMGMENGN